MSWVTHILTCVHVCELISRIQLFMTPWTVAHQAPLLMGFPKQEYWSGLLLQGLFLTQGSNPGLLHLLHMEQINMLGFKPWVRKILWKREWLPTPVFLPGKSHGQRSLENYSPSGHKELDTNEQLT